MCILSTIGPLNVSMLFDQDRLDAIIHNWKNQVFGNKTIHSVPRSAFDVFEAAYRRVPEPRV